MVSVEQTTTAVYFYVLFLTGPKAPLPQAEKVLETNIEVSWGEVAEPPRGLFPVASSCELPPCMSE